jgi:hypothetical protein
MKSEKWSQKNGMKIKLTPMGDSATEFKTSKTVKNCLHKPGSGTKSPGDHSPARISTTPSLLRTIARTNTKLMKNLFAHFAAAMAAMACLLISSRPVLAQGTTAFTYQGQLNDGGTNANGTYTMIFALYDSLSGGNLIGGPITTSRTLANGLFTVNLDFGSGAFNGSARYLDITITNGGTTQELSPRVQVLPSPYALFAAVAATVTNGGIMNAQLAGNNEPNCRRSGRQRSQWSPRFGVACGRSKHNLGHE